MSRDGKRSGDRTAPDRAPATPATPAAGQLGSPAHPSPGVTADPWPQLRALTPARLALGRAGNSLPTAEVLRFGLAHAQARDAVHHELDATALVGRFTAAGYHAQAVHSAASDRWQYLARPDLGRRLDDASREQLAGWCATAPDLVVVVGDGLSAVAVERHALPVLDAACALLAAERPQVLEGLPQDAAGNEASAVAVGTDRVADERPPVVVACEARVALGDDIAQGLGARIVVVMIGERPGLSSPDSMGIYVTHGPRVGRTDAERNCISNVRPAGLSYGAAARELASLIRRMRAHQCSGVLLPVGEPMAKVRGGI